jgi:sugar phosphate isomerase/epimerase
MDIVQRLKRRRIPVQYGFNWTDYEDDKDCQEAADEIERLREALKKILAVKYYGEEGGYLESDSMREFARAVLKGDK